MKKIVALLILGVSFMFAALNLQTATKEELMAIANELATGIRQDHAGASALPQETG